MTVKSPIRQAAIQAGKRRYFTGIPCKNGHIVERLVSNRDCVQCAKSRSRLNSNRYIEHRREYRQKNKRKIQEKAKIWIRMNPKKVAAKTRRWCQANRGTVNARNARRHARKLHATPPWLTESHWDKIKNIYALAAQKDLTVDHIVPLKHKKVCGLHVPWNLQLLSAEQNSKKGNKF